MSTTYDFANIEQKWQKTWQKENVYKTETPSAQKPPYYLLVMFPYPSGKLHMGHVRNYTIGDILARFYRMNGRAVLHPIGWDAFGLPAENAAIKNKTHPAKWTWDNIASMKEQFKQIAISYDWEREFATCDPKYYKWNQWIFIQMFKKGLAYQKTAPVNWCPQCTTVLANEQVHDGHCWRCDSLVTQKELKQWFFKITQYAQELLDGHKLLTQTDKQQGWPEQVLTMQKNWIGASEGAYVTFALTKPASGEMIRVFTTRPDTLFGATFMVLAPEHSLVEKITSPDRKKVVDAYREKARKVSKIDRTALDREKTGEFTGAYAKNPINGKDIPIWIADYVLTDYGTGAIMAVPAHDERDFEFAQKFGIPIIPVIKPREKSLSQPLERAYIGDGLMLNSVPYDNMPNQEVMKKITMDLEKKGKGEATVTYKLRDWLLSRQRYWGTPIPMVNCAKCGLVPVKEADLPVLLPEDVALTGEGASPLSKAEKWVNTKCPSCGGPAKRETDTMDTFVDSSWYYIRYTDPHNDKTPFAKEKARPWLPVHQYVGGIEHATMHLIYARFFHKVLRDLGLVESDEPFASLLTQGMVTLGGSAMSKSKGNIVDPSDVIQKYGADTCRLFILFAAPPTQQLEWSDKQVEGIWRFLNRVWRLGQVYEEGDQARHLKRSLVESESRVTGEGLEKQIHVTIKKVTDDIKNEFGFNTAISSIMELVNTLYLYPDLKDALAKKAIETVVQLLSPFAPHLTEEVWHILGHKDFIGMTPWPVYDSSKMMAQQQEIVIQVNGKLRDRILIPTTLAEKEVTTRALQSLEERGLKIAPKRVIYIPNKLVNFVVQGQGDSN